MWRAVHTVSCLRCKFESLDRRRIPCETFSALKRLRVLDRQYQWVSRNTSMLLDWWDIHRPHRIGDNSRSNQDVLELDDESAFRTVDNRHWSPEHHLDNHRVKRHHSTRSYRWSFWRSLFCPMDEKSLCGWSVANNRFLLLRWYPVNRSIVLWICRNKDDPQRPTIDPWRVERTWSDSSLARYRCWSRCLAGFGDVRPSHPCRYSHPAVEPREKSSWLGECHQGETTDFVENVREA